MQPQVATMQLKRDKIAAHSPIRFSDKQVWNRIILPFPELAQQNFRFRNDGLPRPKFLQHRHLKIPNGWQIVSKSGLPRKNNSESHGQPGAENRAYLFLHLPNRPSLFGTSNNVSGLTELVHFVCKFRIGCRACNHRKGNDAFFSDRRLHRSSL